MKKNTEHKESRGLPGGPNEYITHVSNLFSTEGYKRNSPDVNNPYNIIPSGDITMKGVDFPVRGYGNNGVVQDMTPGVPHYDYGNADYVVEVPMAQDGGDPEMLFKDEYNTALTEEEKIKYNAWVASESKRQGRDIMWDLGTYDIQGFWKSGDHMKMDEDNHGSDKWKKPNHPTFSNQSNYHNVDGYIGGTWAEDGGYTPSDYTTKLYDKNYYDKLFGREPNRPEYLNLQKKQKGGGLLNKTMACNSCGWEWKAADGGNDVSTCHKCGSSALPKAQDGNGEEEKSIWGFVKELAKVPADNISNLLGVMGIPANLIAEATESFTGRGDGEFNFMDAMPSFATPGSDDEIFTFTNQNGTPVKNVAGLKDADGNPLVENPVGAFVTNLATDPSTYVGGGIAKNVIKKGFKTLPKKVVENTAKVVDNVIPKVVDNVTPSWSRGVTNYGKSSEGIQDALSSMKSQGKHLDEIGFNVDDVIAPNVINHGNKFGRQIAEVALPNGQSQLFYKSSGLAGKKGIGKGGTTEGLWQPYGGHATANGTDNWFIKDIGYENFYDSNSFKGIANKLDEIESGWDMSKQLLKSKLKYGGIPKAQDGNKEWIKNWIRTRNATGQFEDQLGNGQMEKGFKSLDDVKKVSREEMVKAGNDDASYWQIGAPNGMYVPSDNIYFSDPGFFSGNKEEDTDIHEQSHVFDIGTSGVPQKDMEEEIPETNIHKAIKNIPVKGGYKTEEYLPPAEIYAELMKFRKKNNIDPNKIYTKDDLLELRKKLKEENDYGLFKLDDIYEDEEILRLMNEVATIDTPQENNIRYAQNGNGEYKVASGDTFYGIANKNKIPWNALKEANPDLDYENLKLGQQLVLPNKIDRSPPMPKTGVSKNSNVLDYNALSSYLADTRGGTTDTWGQLADTIAYHESSPWSRMDPKAKQYQGGPGRGLFQFEGQSFDTALKRYKNVADAQGFTIKDSIVNAKSADELSSEDQYALFLANLIESKAKLSDYTNGNLSPVDVWLQGHKNIEAEGDRNSFLESKKAAEKEGIKNGYKSFQYGNGEWKETVQDNTRIATRRMVPNLGKPEFEPASKLQEFLKQSGVDYANNQILDTTVVRDNTAVTQKQLPFIKDGNLNEPLSAEEYNSVIADLDKESRLEKSKYERPDLISDFTKSSNDYARGWKDMTNASPSEVETLQKDLLSKGYDIGATGADGNYGARTLAAHKSMIDDVNLAPSAISKYYKNYTPDNKEEVLKIQQDLVDKGFMSATLLNKEGSSIDGKFGQQTKEALQAYNTKKTKEDPNALVFDFIPSKLEDGRCAAGMCSILEGNNVMTESLGVKYKNAWDIFENMNDVENSKSIFNIYDDKAFDNATSAEDIKRITKEVKRKKQTKASDYKTGDIVGLYWDGSSHHEETLNSKTHNTHTGFVSDVIDGVPIITHNVNGTVLQQPYDELVTGWIRRPSEDIKVNSTYNVDGIEDIEIDPSTITNLSLRYQSGDYEGERLTQLENVFKRAKYNSTKIPEILNSSVDPKWLESTIVGITGAETGVGASVPRSKEEAGYFKNMVYDAKGYKSKDVSLGIGKTKLTALDNFAKSYFQINSAEDLGKSDDKAIDAITYLITKNYETFKDYSNTYAELNLAEEDIRNMSILAYNQGTNRLLKTGRVADSRNAETEVQALRELYDATLLDINSTNYKHLPIIGDAAFKVGQVLPTGMPGSVRPSDSYIKKVNQYRTDLFPENYAYVETPANDFEPSTMAHGGEPKSKVNELTMYKNYMKGMYDNTNMQKQAQKVYDKLNRVYLRKARLGGTTSPNYIMSNIIRETA